MTALFNSYNTSSTYNFYPSNLEIIASAFERIQIKRTELEQPHFANAVGELNLFLAAFNNAGPNLAQVDQQSISLVAGVSSYSILTNTITILDAFVTIGTGTTAFDQYMYQISRTEFAAIPQKTIQGRPNQFWFDRLQSPQVILYPQPDGNGPYVFNYYRFRQVQDSVVANGTTPEVPNRALDAIVSGLAYRLARIYRPELEDKRKADAAEAWSVYAKQDTENVNTYIVPALSHYYRI